MTIKQYSCSIVESDYIEVSDKTYKVKGLSIQIYAPENHIILNKKDALNLANDIKEMFGEEND